MAYKNKPLQFIARLLFSGAILFISLLLPQLLQAQGTDPVSEFPGLQGVLEQVYQKMIVHSSELIAVSQKIAGFGAFLYIVNLAFSFMASAHPIVLYPMLRPFAIGIAIILFPSLLSLINGVLQPTVSSTNLLAQGSGQAVATLLQQKEELLKNSAEWQMYIGPDGGGNLGKWEELSGQADSGAFSGITNRLKFTMSQAYYNFRNNVKAWLSEVLEVIFEAAALCLNTVRTFYLIVLGVLGPLVFAFSVFPSFASGLVNWFSRYIGVFLWLPVANLFGSLISQIQAELIKIDIAQYTATGATTFGAAGTIYTIFLLMGIIGYFCIPSIAGYLVNAANVSSTLNRAQQLIKKTVNL